MRNSSGQGEKTVARRLVEASAWRTHLAENDLESTPGFEAWLSDGGNSQAWNRVQQSWDLFAEHAASPELIDLRRRALGRVRAMGRQRSNARYSWISRFRRQTIAAGILIIAAAGAITFNFLSPDVYRTAAGERRVVTLSDGSKIQLDSLTELQVDYSDKARDLKLIKGQARFDVAHDVERPFSVVAGQKKVVATGTAFNVDLLGSNLYVTLIEGKVVILPQDLPEFPKQLIRPPAPQTEAQSKSAAPSKLPSKPVKVAAIELEAGQKFAAAESGATSVEPANVQQATAWQSGQLIFENEPLASVIPRINRYAEQPVEVTDEAVASMEISGVFNAGDVDGFVSTITRYLPIQAERSGEVIHLSSRAPSSKPHRN